MRRLLAASLFAALLCLACAAAPRAEDVAPAQPTAPVAASFSAAQRAEIVEIVRAALKADPSILRDAVVALRTDEANVKEAAARAALDRAGPALTRAEGDPSTGDPNGDVTVVEFYDLRCPYCRRMLPILADLLRQDPKLRLVYKDIPVLGPASVLGARAVLAAQRQGGYQRMHDLIMAGPEAITADTLHQAATTAGLDWDKLQRDMADPAIAARINTNLDLARDLGVEGTPVYVVGKRILPGAVDLAELQAAVAAARTP
jgi:protein-disulfide isomerase